jgi:hypothetical protein
MAELLSNPGFETGDFTNWDLVNRYATVSFTVDTEHKHSGSYAMKWQRPASGAHWEEQVRQDVSLTVGEWYTISFWVYCENTLDETGFWVSGSEPWWKRTPPFRLLRNDESVRYDSGNKLDIDSDGWHQHKINFQALDTNETIVFSTGAANTPTAEVWLDDISVQPMDFGQKVNNLDLPYKGSNFGNPWGNVHKQWREDYASYGINDFHSTVHCIKDANIRFMRWWASLDCLIDDWDVDDGYTEAASMNTQAVANVNAVLDMFDDHDMLIYLMMSYKQELAPHPQIFGMFREEAVDGNHPTMAANYLNAYADWVDLFKHHSCIWGWDYQNEAFDALGNTGRDDHVVRDFLADVYKTVKTHDPNRYVSIAASSNPSFANLGDYVPPWNPTYVSYENTNVQRVQDFRHLHTSVCDAGPLYTLWFPESIDTPYGDGKTYILSKDTALFETGHLDAAWTQEYIIGEFSDFFDDIEGHGYQHCSIWTFSYDTEQIVERSGSPGSYVYTLTEFGEWIGDQKNEGLLSGNSTGTSSTTGTLGKTTTTLRATVSAGSSSALVLRLGTPIVRTPGVADDPIGRETYGQKNAYADYKVVMVDNISGNELAEMVYFSELKFKWGLNQVGDFSFVLPLRDFNANPEIVRPLVRKARVYRNGNIIFEGDVYTVNVGNMDGAPTVTVAGNGYLRRLDYRMTTNKTYTNRWSWYILYDQLRSINAVQDTGMKMTSATFEETYKRTIEVEKDKPFTELLEEVAAADQAVYFVGINGYLWYWTERFSTTRDELNFEYGANIENPELELDGTQMCNFAHVYGGESGGSPVIRTGRNENSINEWGLFERTESFTDHTETAYLDAQKARLLADYRDPIENYKFMLIPERAPEYNAFKLGDRCQLKINRGYFKVNRLVRIIGYEFDVQPGGLEKINVLTTVPSTISRRTRDTIRRLTKLEKKG